MGLFCINHQLTVHYLTITWILTKEINKKIGNQMILRQNIHLKMTLLLPLMMRSIAINWCIEITDRGMPPLIDLSESRIQINHVIKQLYSLAGRCGVKEIKHFRICYRTSIDL